MCSNYFFFYSGKEWNMKDNLPKSFGGKLYTEKKLYKWNKNYHKPVIIQHTNNEALTRSHFKSIQNFVKKKQNIPT